MTVCPSIYVPLLVTFLRPAPKSRSYFIPRYRR